MRGEEFRASACSGWNGDLFWSHSFYPAFVTWI